MAGLVPAIHVLRYFGMMRGGFIYILTNRPNGTLYVGVTSDLLRRVFEHRSGMVEGFTRRYGLKRLVYFERFEDIRTAIQREHNIKHWPRAWKVRLIVADNPEWDDLFESIAKQDVDGRDKPGHDGVTFAHPLNEPSPAADSLQAPPPSRKSAAS